MKAVFFDLDGTLFDTLADIAYALNYALAAYDIPKVPEKEVRHFVGRGLRNALAQAVVTSGKRVEEDDFDLMYELMLSAYRKHPADRTVLYPGINELLSELKEKGLKLGLLSNKADSIVQGILAKYPLDLDFASGAVPGVPLKPDPSLYFSALEKLGVRPEETVYVGDSEVDAAFARRSGSPCLIVSYGFRTEAELEAGGITDTLKNTAELRSALLGL